MLSHSARPVQMERERIIVSPPACLAPRRAVHLYKHHMISSPFACLPGGERTRLLTGRPDFDPSKCRFFGGGNPQVSKGGAGPRAWLGLAWLHGAAPCLPLTQPWFA